MAIAKHIQPAEVIIAQLQEKLVATEANLAYERELKKRKCDVQHNWRSLFKGKSIDL